MRGAILSFQVIRQVYDLSICKGADGSLHTTISLKMGSSDMWLLLGSPQPPLVWATVLFGGHGER